MQNHPSEVTGPLALGDCPKNPLADTLIKYFRMENVTLSLLPFNLTLFLLSAQNVLGFQIEKRKHQNKRKKTLSLQNNPQLPKP